MYILKDSVVCFRAEKFMDKAVCAECDKLFVILVLLLWLPIQQIEHTTVYYEEFAEGIKYSV